MIFASEFMCLHDHTVDWENRTLGAQKATLVSAPKASSPSRLQSATAVCLLAPADKYSTETFSLPISSAVARLGCWCESENCVRLVL